jgi:hypothetical protein
MLRRQGGTDWGPGIWRQEFDGPRVWRSSGEGILEFIPIKPLVATASSARESYAAHRRLP